MSKQYNFERPKPITDEEDDDFYGKLSHREDDTYPKKHLEFSFWAFNSSKEEADRILKRVEMELNEPEPFSVLDFVGSFFVLGLMMLGVYQLIQLIMWMI